MDSVQLLVVDQSPESAEQINSLLRNSGIRIHVLHVKSCAEIKRELDNKKPLMLLYCDVDENKAPAEEVHNLSTQYNVRFAIYQDLSKTTDWIEWVKAKASFVINSSEPNQLIEVVSRLIESWDDEQSFSSQKQQLEELEHRYELLLDSARDAIAYIHEGLHIYANRAYREALHLTDDAMAGLSILEVMNSGDINLKSVLKNMSKGIFPEKSLPANVKRPDQSSFDAELIFSPARFNGENCIQMMVRERDAQAELTAELERIRHTDVLTGLSNKKAFTQFLKSVANDDPDSVTAKAVLYLEPDGMQQISHDIGDKEADEVIVDLGRVIKKNLREGDLAGRISDHGFAVIINRESKDSLEQSGRELQQEYGNHIVELENRSFSATCSIGLVALGRLSVVPEEIISQAKQAHKEAAQSGESIVVYRPQLTAITTVEDDRGWLDRLRFAITNQDFYSVQQSIVDLDGEGEHLVENLTFMREEDNNYPPEDYADIADRVELGGVIDRHVIPGLLQTFADSNERQIISLSNNSILDFGFPSWFADQMKLNAVSGDKIVLQIGLNAAQSNLKPAQMLMQELEPLGVKLAVSSFNADRRALQLLEHLQISYVKLSAEITENLITNSENQELLRSIVDSADEHKIAVIADEINDTSSLAMLWQCGVKLIAGAFLKEDSQVVA